MPPRGLRNTEKIQRLAGLKAIAEGQGGMSSRGICEPEDTAPLALCPGP